MASIDRYRPPREGYQPPTIAAGSRNSNSNSNNSNHSNSNSISNHEQASRSPSRRRDVPPAAPTPPQHSALTSPPRSVVKPSSSQQSQSPSGGRTPSAISTSQWFFTSEEVHSTPSIIDGIPPSEERLRRAKGVNFIYQAGVALDLPQITLWVAGVFFHRFYMRFGMVQEKGGIHHYNIAATALFLANKVEENCRKTKDIIIAVAKVAQKNAKLVIDEQSKEYWRWRDSILTYEEVMLEQLTFDLMVDNPYRQLFEMLEMLDIVHNKNLRQAAWAFCNDACLTALPLLIEARDVAISAIFFAAVHANQPIDDINGLPWWKYLNGDKERCVRSIEVMRQFYTENPLKKANPSLPSPAFDLENTRRRADTISSGGRTPFDRASRSPTVRANGGTERGHEGDGHDDAASRTEVDSLRSPPKRKEIEANDSPGQETADKRVRLSEDEGELVED